MFKMIKQGTTEKLIIAITTSRFSTGAKYTASAITATFFKVNAGGNALEIDTTIGASGVVTLSADTGGKTGFHTALLDVSALTAKKYAVLFEATVDGVAAAGVFELDINAQLASIATNLNVAVSSRSTISTAQVNIECDAAIADAGIPAAVWAVSTRTLSSFGSLVADIATSVWGAITRTLTGGVPSVEEINTELSTNHGSGAWGASGAVALPVMQGSVYEATAMQSREVRIVRGDTPRIYFDLGDDYTGWTPKFGAKAALSDTEYAIAVKDGSWTDASAGQGYIDLTADETGTAGVLIGEIELQKDTQRLTAMRFKLVILEDVIDD
jgi:hypothetical protein